MSFVPVLCIERYILQFHNRRHARRFEIGTIITARDNNGHPAGRKFCELVFEGHELGGWDECSDQVVGQPVGHAMEERGAFLQGCK